MPEAGLKPLFRRDYLPITLLPGLVNFANLLRSLPCSATYA